MHNARSIVRFLISEALAIRFHCLPRGNIRAPEPVEKGFDFLLELHEHFAHCLNISTSNNVKESISQNEKDITAITARGSEDMKKMDRERTDFEVP
ncbi:hypothetical protein RUND412_009623 [Rhizina undulata]